MSFACLLFVYLISFAHSTTLGSWGECSDLDKVKSDVESIGNDIRALLVSSGDQVASTDSIDITSTGCQLVAGMNYKVTFNIATFESITIQYFIGLPVNGVEPAPTKLQVLDLGYQLITDASSLAEVQLMVQSLDDRIRALLLQDAFEIEESAEIEFVSARYQVEVALKKYKLRINASPYHDIVLSYVDTNNPTDLQLVDAGYKSIHDLTEVTAAVQFLDSEIRSLLKTEGSSIEDSSVIHVTSAESRVFPGFHTFNVTLSIGMYENVMISYDVIDLPILIHGVPQNYPKDLELLDKGYESVNDLGEVEATVDYLSDDIRSLLIANGLSIETHSTMVVISAESQVNIGTTYRVTLNVARYTNVIVSYYIGYPFLVMGVPQNNPSDLRLIDAGTQRESAVLGGYKEVSDLDAIRHDVANIADTIRSLLGSEGLAVSASDAVRVVSAQAQVVAGMNYRVTLCVGSHEDVIVQYFVALPVNDATQTPQQLEVIDLGCVAPDDDTGDDLAGSYHAVDDLSEVKGDVLRIKDDIVALLRASGLRVGADDSVAVVSAESQVVAGMNYRVKLNIGSHLDVVVSYFVDLSDEMPQDLKLIDSGHGLMGDDLAGSYHEMHNLSVVEADVRRIADDIGALLNSNGLMVEKEDQITVKAARRQVVAGINYEVTLDVAHRYFDVVIQYFVDLPLNDPQQTPQDLKLIDVGTQGQTVTQSSDDDVQSDNDGTSLHLKSKAVLIVVAVALALCVIAFVVGFVVCLTKKKTKHHELYAQLNGDTGDAIDANL
eukprot:206794_1